MAQMYSVTCDDPCGFMVKSHNKEEVVDVAYQHVRTQHPDQTVTREEVMADVKEEEAM